MRMIVDADAENTQTQLFEFMEVKSVRLQRRADNVWTLDVDNVVIRLSSSHEVYPITGVLVSAAILITGGS